MRLWTIIIVGSPAEPFGVGDHGPGVSISGSPPSYVAACPGGFVVSNLPIAGVRSATEALGSVDAGPYLSVRGAAGVLDVDGIYKHSEESYQHYTKQSRTKGNLTLLWEPGPQVVYGLRWLILGPNSTRATALYYKYTSDSFVGWRGTNTSGLWSANEGAAPAPLVESLRPEEYLNVSGAGGASVNGHYTRDTSGLHPPDFKVYERGDHLLLFEYGPQYFKGNRWVLYTDQDPVRGVGQNFPYFYRNSSDGDFGYQGAWELSQAPYPPPSVHLVQGVTCVRCPAGSFAGAGDARCRRCAPGSYSLGAQDACTLCEPGTYSASPDVATKSSRKMSGSCDARYLSASPSSCTHENPGATRCEACLPGTYAPAALAECRPCAPGTRSGKGATVCDACLPGRHSGLAASTCLACPAGRSSSTLALPTYTPGGGPACSSCSPGTASGAAATECQACQLGYYAAGRGQRACEPCKSGSASIQSGSSMCMLCPDKGGPPGRASCSL